MKSSFSVEVHQIPTKKDLGITKGDPASIINRRRSVRLAIEAAAQNLGVEVVETKIVEPAQSGPLKPPFFKELRELRDTVPDLPIPNTVSFKEFMSAPFFPVVAKKTTSSLGKNKFLIETAEQLRTFTTWATIHGQGTTLPAWVFQGFVDCPSEHFTSYRVLVDCLGRIIAAQLMYGARKDSDRRLSDAGLTGASEPESQLMNPSGSSFLGARDITSSLIFTRPISGSYEAPSRRAIPTGSFDAGSYETVNPPFYGGSFDSGSFELPREAVRSEPSMVGGRICLNGRLNSHPTDSRERKILIDHGLDPRHPRLPAKIASMSSEIARKFGMQGKTIKELWFTMDWMQSKKGDVFFLEKNHRSRLVSLRDLEGGAEKFDELETMRWLIHDILATMVEQKRS